eukprot:6185402-Pleurochrysis_carterae.AAC.2
MTCGCVGVAKDAARRDAGVRENWPLLQPNNNGRHARNPVLTNGCGNFELTDTYQARTHARTHRPQSIRLEVWRDARSRPRFGEMHACLSS